MQAHCVCGWRRRTLTTTVVLQPRVRYSGFCVNEWVCISASYRLGPSVSLATLLAKIASCTGLFALAYTIVEALALYVLPSKSAYAAFMVEQATLNMSRTDQPANKPKVS